MLTYLDILPFRKTAQDFSAFSTSRPAQIKTLADLYDAVRIDSGLTTLKRVDVIQEIQRMTHNAPPSTPLSVLFKGGSTVLGGLIAKYFGMGIIGQLITAAAGFGLGTSIYNKMTAPKPMYPHYRMLGGR